MAYRLEKVASLLKSELGMIFLTKFSGTEYSLATVTSVKVTPDLKIARIYVSLIDKDKRESLLEELKAKKGSIRSELAGKINLRYTPELEFFIDDTLDYVEKMEDLFKKIHEDDNKTDQ